MADPHDKKAERTYRLVWESGALQLNAGAKVALRVLAERDSQRRKALEAETTKVCKVLDLVLEPEDAENAIGNLLEAYERRRGDRAHAKRWLWAQAGWIVVNRGVELLGRIRSAWKTGR